MPTLLDAMYMVLAGIGIVFAVLAILLVAMLVLTRMLKPEKEKEQQGKA